MLRSTFLHLPGISEAKEQELWGCNIMDWDDALWAECMTERCRTELLRSKHEYSKKNHAYFASSLPTKHHWRAYPDFCENCCYLDIETTGLSRDRDKITVIGLYDGKESKVFVNGKDLDRFQDEIKRYSTIITFNGISFDLPFIKAKFPGLEFPHLHIDLRYLLRDIGYTGGLKVIEKKLGIERDDGIKGMDGYMAVVLWKRYERGNEDALKKLIQYNIADIENLKTLMEFAFKRKKAKMHNNPQVLSHQVHPSP